MEIKLNKSSLEKYFSDPLWYMNNLPEQEYLFSGYDGMSDEEKQDKSDLKIKFIELVGELIEEGKVSVASKGPDFDEERKEIDTIIIHHTGYSSSRAQDPLKYINALDMLTIYAPQFRLEANEYYKTPMWSNHFYKNKMTFVPYHHLIWKDGKHEQVLKDEYIGWHCGNWETNCRSIAVTFIDDLEESEPTPEALESAREIIKKYKPKNLLGHREVKNTTICPGNKFLGGWKGKLYN